MVGCELRSRHFPLFKKPNSVIQARQGRDTNEAPLTDEMRHVWPASSLAGIVPAPFCDEGPSGIRIRRRGTIVGPITPPADRTGCCRHADGNLARARVRDRRSPAALVRRAHDSSYGICARRGFVLRMLVGGTDLNPPLHHLTVRAVTPFLGYGPLALRVPSIAGFGLMAVCLYAIMRRHVGRAAACVALLLPFTTRAYWYAFEARPYGLMMGFSALALFCWQSAAADRRRTLALVGLMLSLAAAISTHFYTVFVFLALASGELARTLARRRLDLAVWAAFGLGALPLGLFIPVIASARSRSIGFWSQPSMTKCFDFYSWLISTEAIFPLVVLGLVSVCLATLARPVPNRPGPTDDKSPRKMPIHECVALVAFTLIPVFTHVVALTITHAFVERYALTAVIGLSAMTALFFDWRPRGKMAALVPAVVFLFWVAFVQVIVCRRVTSERDAYALLSRELRAPMGSSCRSWSQTPETTFNCATRPRSRLRGGSCSLVE